MSATIQPPISPALLLVRQAAETNAPHPELTPQQQTALLIALVAQFSALDTKLSKMERVQLIILGILIGTVGAEKIISLFGV